VTRAVWAVCLAAFANAAHAQTAQISGLIQDPSGLKVAAAEINVRNEQTGGRRMAESNETGSYSVFSLSPGVYRIYVRASGFETIVRDGIKLEVGENARIDFNLRIGDSRSVVTVHGDPVPVNTQDASVGTVIDRNIIDEMPLNGRGIQTLIELSPGVIPVPATDTSRGQFAINGQRADTNYFTVDGVTVDFSAGDTPAGLFGTNRIFSLGEAGAGTIPANNFLGTFSNLVSPDALEEFKIQTSTFAPEFGRSPGAQIGLVSRSGGNRYTGSAFEYFRNDKLDASDWFSNQQGLPKPPLRFNNFGVTLGGPLEIPHVYDGHDRTFFFFSFDDLLLAQPQPVEELEVPSLAARRGAPAVAAPFLDAYPLPNRPPLSAADAALGLAAFAGSYSLLDSQQSYGLRIDHAITDRLVLFGRFNHAPSHQQGGVEGETSNPANIEHYLIGTDMLTVGLTHTITPHLVNELRMNLSQQNSNVTASIRPVDGAQVLPQSALFPPGYSFADSSVFFAIPSIYTNPYILDGKVGQDRARQLNFVDNLSYSRGSHQFKFGVDYRLFGPSTSGTRLGTFILFPSIYGSNGLYGGVGDVITGSFNLWVQGAQDGNASYLVKSFSAYAQDTWRITHRLTATYGVRWEVDPPPRLASGMASFAVLHSLDNFASVTTAPPGTPLYATGYRNFAPRLGVAWQIASGSRGITVLRAGAGLFYDLGQAGFEDSSYQSMTFTGMRNQPLGTLPLGPSSGSLTATGLEPPIAAAPGYTLPRVYQWNVTLEQSFGPQTFSAGYVAALGRRLTGYAEVPSTTYGYIEIFGNDSSSSYNALQVHYDRRVSKRVQAIMSYTWAHSIDDGSYDLPPVETVVIPSPDLFNFLHANINKGSSDFDIRHALNGALLAALPSPSHGAARKLLRNWTASAIFFAHSALPNNLVTTIIGGAGWVRANLNPGQPLYLYGSGYPGGKSINAGAFSQPANDAEEGTLGRNVLRGFPAWQIDFALHRDFRLTERTALQFRIEAFNVLNHPNFANPGLPGDPTDVSLIGYLRRSNNTLANVLAPGVPGQLNSLFQIGSPRSIQLALRLSF
jgi:Carboxypeptidase regulatory-like domain/TonB dependent receptor